MIPYEAFLSRMHRFKAPLSVKCIEFKIQFNKLSVTQDFFVFFVFSSDTLCIPTIPHGGVCCSKHV